MLKRLLRYIKGYLMIYLKGDSRERFLNLCRNKGILIWDFGIRQGMETGYISLGDYRKLRPVIHKTRTFPYIIKKTGLPFILAKYRRRKVFFFSLALFFFVIWFLSCFIWDIEFSGQSYHTKEALLKYLRGTGVYGGMWTKDVDCKQIEENLRKQYTDIGWVSAELDGTKLKIRILENIIPEDKQETKKTGHLVANRAGRVISIVTRTGTPQVHKGDKVKKGDVLISGIVNIIGDNDTLLRKETVYADGDVVLECTYTYEDSFPMQYVYRKKTGRSRRLYGVQINNLKLFYYNPLKKFESYQKYDIITSGDFIGLNQALRFPASWSCKEYAEIEPEIRQYTEKQAKKLAEEHFAEYLTGLDQKGISCRSRQFFTEIRDGSCVSKGSLVVWVPQKKYKKIKKSEWRLEKQDEHNGDNN